MTLLVAPVGGAAARHAVSEWHYSRTMPKGRLICYGVWETDRFIGVVVYGRGSTPVLLAPYGLRQNEGCELVRVALRDHTHPVTQIVAQSIRLLRSSNPGLRLIVSFADPKHGHRGGIYQAGGWLYLGDTDPVREFRVAGVPLHNRSVAHLRRRTVDPGDGESRLEWLRRVHDPRTEQVDTPGKHRYVFPLDRQMRRMLTKQARPYPRGEGIDSDPPTNQSEVPVQLRVTAP